MSHSNKENKGIYKQMVFRKGLFQIKNLKDNKVFLKTSSDLDRAFNSDSFQLRLGSHRNTALQQDWNSLGQDNFEFSVLDELNTDENLTDMDIKKELQQLHELYIAECNKEGIVLY